MDNLLSTNPEYLAEVRKSLNSTISRLKQQQEYYKSLNRPGAAKGVSVAIGIIERDLIGGQGCVIGAFDHRLPELIDNLNG